MPQRRRHSKHEVGACVDRISNLPADVIRLILSLVPLKDVARTSVLSRRWNSIWLSRPDIYLNEVLFGADFHPYTFGKADRDRPRRDAFLTYLEEFLECRENMCECHRVVDKFFLRLTVTYSSTLLARKWIDYALKNKVKRLSLYLQEYDYQRFSLDNTLFFSATLVELSITECTITQCSYTLPNLRSLLLYDVWIGDEQFADLVAGCPRIEVLIIVHCPEELYTMAIPNPLLKILKVNHSNSHYCKIQIESKNLESLALKCLDMDNCEVEITSLSTVKSLTLEWVHSKEAATLTRFINKFSHLEKLLIDDCRQNCYVSLPNLTSFVLRVYSGGTGYPIEEVRMNAPKLKYFEYTGGLTSFTGIKASHKLEYVKFHLKPPVLDARWYIWLRNTLESFAHSKLLSLICQNEQAINFPDELTEILFPTINDLKNLELRIISCYATSEDILDGFCWILPCLKTLSLTLGSISKLIKFPK